MINWALPGLWGLSTKTPVDLPRTGGEPSDSSAGKRFATIYSYGSSVYTYIPLILLLYLYKI